MSRLVGAADGTLLGRKFGEYNFCVVGLTVSRLLVGVLVRVSDGLIVEVDGREEIRLEGIEVGEIDGFVEGGRTERPIVGRKEGAELDKIVGIEFGTSDEGERVVRAVVGRKERDADRSELEITVGIEVGISDGRLEEERAERTFVGRKEGDTLLVMYVGEWVGEELRGPLNTTLKADSFGLLTVAAKLILIVPEVTTTSIENAPSTPNPSCAYRSILVANRFLLLVPSPMLILNMR